MRLAPRGLAATLALSVAALAAACGDDGPSATPDGGPGIDAAPTADAPGGGGCDYTEQDDLGNDDYAGTGAPEATGLTLASRLVVCGLIDAGHFIEAESMVDADGYQFTVAQPTDVVITMAGLGADTLEALVLDVYGGPTFNQFITSADLVGSHGATSVRLPAGTYQLLLVGFDLEAPGGAIPYTITVRADAPATRCPVITTGGYTEAGDGAQGTGNDMVGIMIGSRVINVTATASMMDAPEATDATIAAGATQRLAGTFADVATADTYEDKDTYLLTTGASTDQLTIRVAPAGATVDADFYVFAPDTTRVVLSSRALSPTDDEFRTFAVLPNTPYWLTVAARATSTGLPAAYDVSVCGAQYAP